MGGILLFRFALCKGIISYHIMEEAILFCELPKQRKVLSILIFLVAWAWHGMGSDGMRGVVATLFIGKVAQWRLGGHGFNPYIPQWCLVK